MTLLDTLLANSLDTTTAAVSIYTTCETVDDESALSTTIVSAASTLLDSIEVPDIYVTREVSAYVETMPTEELTRGLELLDEKSLEFQLPEPNTPKETTTKDPEKVLKIGQKQL